MTQPSSDWHIDTHGRMVANERIMTQGLNRQRNPILKSAFKGTALTVEHYVPTHPLDTDYRRLVKQGTRALPNENVLPSRPMRFGRECKRNSTIRQTLSAL